LRPSLGTRRAQGQGVPVHRRLDRRQGGAPVGHGEPRRAARRTGSVRPRHGRAHRPEAAVCAEAHQAGDQRRPGRPGPGERHADLLCAPPSGPCPQHAGAWQAHRPHGLDAGHKEASIGWGRATRGGVTSAVSGASFWCRKGRSHHWSGAPPAGIFRATMKPQNIAIVGATGAVGVEILRVLERRNFPVASLKLLASARSVGKTLEFKGKPYPVEELKASAFKGVDIAFFSAGATRSREFVPAAKAAGCVVVDNSSAFRMDPDTPLVVPEGKGAAPAKHNGIVANPNCPAAILSVAVWPIHQAAGVKRIIVSTYQSASGAGAAAMQELEDQARDFSAGKEIKRSVFPHQIAFNVFSHNTKVAENGYNEEENKVVEETRKMFHLPELPIAPTCIRVPVLRAHSEAITLELEKPLSPAEARAILAKAPGVKVVDDAPANPFPMPLEASGDLDVHVGRIRRDLSNPNGLMLWVAGDQLLKGAAWNAVQIAEELAKLSAKPKTMAAECASGYWPY